jgi:hypothetical protein
MVYISEANQGENVSVHADLCLPKEKTNYDQTLVHNNKIE